MTKFAKRAAIALIGMSLFGCATARQGATVRQDESFYDKAEVTQVTPIYEIVEVNTPETRCWDETVRRRQSGGNSLAGTIVGGIVGGVVGHQIGGGRGKDVATVAGSVIGAAVGHEVADDHRPPRYSTDTTRHCEEVDRISEEERLVGYRVEYQYKGHTFFTRTDEHPGKWIRVAVDVEPVDY